MSSRHFPDGEKLSIKNKSRHFTVSWWNKKMTVSRLVSMFMSIFLPRIQEHGPVWSVRREDYVTSQPCPRPSHVPQDTTVLQGHRFHGPVLQSVFPVYSSFLSVYLLCTSWSKSTNVNSSFHCWWHRGHTLMTLVVTLCSTAGPVRQVGFAAAVDCRVPRVSVILDTIVPLEPSLPLQ